jgi:vitamin B12 transporter
MRECMERQLMNQKNLASRIALAVSAVCGTSAVLAQDDLEETVVTATRTPRPLDSVGTPVIVITRNDIERSLATDVSELLQQQAGLEVARNGGPGQTTSLFTRGTESNHTVVLVDGMRINPGTIGGAALQNISPESLERIEIVKGPGSSLYGTDAIGGVVQLFTRGADQTGASAGATYGSNATQQVSGDAAWSGERVKLGAGGGYTESDGMPVFVDDEVDRGYRDVTARVFGEVAASDALKFRARGWNSTGRTEYSTQTFSTPPYAPVSQDFENSVYSLETEYRRNDGFGVRASIGRTLDDIEQLQAGFGPAELDYARTRRVTGEVQVDLARIGTHSLSMGAAHSDERARAQSFGTVIDEGTMVNQAFVQDQFDLGKIHSRLAVGYVDHETFGNEITWNADFGIAIGTGTRVSISGGKAFRAPDSTDRFGFGGNPDLKPEVSEQVELTLRQNFGRHQQAWLSAFDNRIDDLISFVFDPVTFESRNENIDSARIKGVELGYQFAGETWRARAELTLQDPRSETNDERLLRRSREALVLAVSRDVGPLDVGVDLQAYGNRKDFAFPDRVTLDSYTLVNATLRYRVNGGLTLQARLENAFDEAYTQVQGYRTEGRSYTIGARYSFE